MLPSSPYITCKFVKAVQKTASPNELLHNNCITLYSVEQSPATPPSTNITNKQIRWKKKHIRVFTRKIKQIFFSKASFFFFHFFLCHQTLAYYFAYYFEFLNFLVLLGKYVIYCKVSIFYIVCTKEHKMIYFYKEGGVAGLCADNVLINKIYFVSIPKTNPPPQIKNSNHWFCLSCLSQGVCAYSEGNLSDLTMH